MDNFSWLVGIIEGEGCITCKERIRHKKYKETIPEIIISMCDKDIIEKIAFLLNCKYRSYTPSGKTVSGKNYKIQHRITICGRKAIFLMEKMEPYFSERRKEQIHKVNEKYVVKSQYKTNGYIPRPKKPIILPLFENNE
jgi:hypothetical protein